MYPSFSQKHSKTIEEGLPASSQWQGIHFIFQDAQCLDPKNLGDALFGNPNRRLLLYRGKETGLSSDQMVGFVQNWNKADALNVNTVRKNPNTIQGLSMTRMHWRKAAEGVLNFASVGLLITYGTISAFGVYQRSCTWFWMLISILKIKCGFPVRKCSILSCGWEVLLCTFRTWFWAAWSRI